jgi:hypothetical protein
MIRVVMQLSILPEAQRTVPGGSALPSTTVTVASA